MDDRNGWPERFTKAKPNAGPPLTADAQDALLRASKEVMAVQDITWGERSNPLRVRGTLTLAAEQAFQRLRPQFEALGYTPLLRHDDGLDIIGALPTVFEHPESTSRTTRIAWLLFAITVISVFITGMQQTDDLYISGIGALFRQITGNWEGVPRALIPSPEVIRASLLNGLMFTGAMLGILGSHEMGHFIMARRHKVHTTPPFFIPMPLSILGTMGAVIAMREPAPNRRIQFDIGVAGPLAGLIVAIPLMLIGLSLSKVETIQQHMANVPPSIADNTVIYQEGDSLAYLAFKGLVYGRFLPAHGDLGVWWHPIAFAAWAGFLVTMLNLIPVGQLDGGHIVYGLFGQKARMFRVPVLITLGVMAFIGTMRDLLANAPPGSVPIDASLVNLIGALPGWSTWWLWVALIYFLLRSHAPVLDEITGLDTKRRVLGMVMLVVFVLIFTPTPLLVKQVELAHSPLIQQIAALLR